MRARHSVWCASACLVFAPLFVTFGSAQESSARLRALLPTDESAARVGLVRSWYGFAPIDGVRERVQRASVVGNELHLQTNMSRIHVLDAETGKQLWTAQLGVPIANQFGAALNSDSLFVINGSYLYRLSREDGSQLWSLRLPQAANAAPAADEDRVVVSTGDGRIYVYNVNTREMLWFFQMNAVVSMPAVFIDDKIACASEDGMLYVFSLESRQPIFRYSTDAELTSPISTWGRSVLMGSRDYSIYSVDVRTGETRWRFPSGSEVHQPLSVIQNEVYVVPDEGGLIVLNADTGQRIWGNPRAERFVAASAKRVYASDRYGQLMIMDRSNGRLVGMWDTHEFDYRVRNVASDRLFLVTRSGLVVCLHEKEHAKPLMHESVPAQPGAAPEAAVQAEPSP